MWNEKYYLCRSPMTNYYVFVNEKDYKYMRHHEASLRVPDPDNALELLAHGSKREMDLLYNLAIGRSNKC